MGRNELRPFQDILREVLGKELNVTGATNLSGGCIHNALKLETDEGYFFIKQNQAADADMFEKEFMGLKILRESGEIDVPEALHHGVYNGNSYILTEFIDAGLKSRNFFENFGQKLAGLHRNHSDLYGLDHNNYIGRLPQYNDPSDDWFDFFIGMRLEKQVSMALDQGMMDRSYLSKFDNLYRQLPDLLPDEPASLLHGDLWSGNFMTGPEGEAVLIDPAVYYGNREIELSFTRMFGGFDSIFYQSYDEEYPLSPGFDQRADIYNLYPTLVHLNMFGKSYMGGIDSVLREYS